MSVKIDEYGRIHRELPQTTGNTGAHRSNNDTGNDDIERIREPWYSKGLNYWLVTMFVSIGLMFALQIPLFSRLYMIITNNQIHTIVAVVIGIIGGVIICILYNVRGAYGEYIPKHYALSILASVVGSFVCGFCISIIWGIIVAVILVVIILALAG